MPGPQGQRCRESGHPAPLQAPLGQARPDSHAICAYPCAPRSGTQPGMTAFRRPLLRRRWKFCCSDAMALAAHARRLALPAGAGGSACPHGTARPVTAHGHAPRYGWFCHRNGPGPCPGSGTAHAPHRRRPGRCFRRRRRRVGRLPQGCRLPVQARHRRASGHLRTGMGCAGSTGTAVTLFWGEPSTSLSE